MQPILKATAVTKAFFGNQVLKGIDFEGLPGEVLGLVGENGAGKSTLMKIITGLYTMDSGEIFLDGKKIEIHDPKEAKDAGLSIIHQEFNLFPNLSAAENIFLDREEYRNRFGKVNWKKINADARKILEELGADFDLGLPVSQLSVREQQLVEISKAISTNAKVLIMDEPTAALPSSEVQNMFALIRLLKERGVAVVFISHRMQEIEQICDRVTVLRDGMNVAVVEMEENRIDYVISMMIGRQIDDYYPHSARRPGEDALIVDRLCGDNVRNVSLKLARGEVLGLYGLAGAGVTDVAEMIMGLKPYASGSICFEGRKLSSGSTKAALSNGIGYVPSDRAREGVVLEMPIDQNTILANLKSYASRGFLNRKWIAESVDRHIENLKIRCASRSQDVKNLSGGNQQKVVLAKWMDRNPRLLVLNEPTRGVDVGAKREIYMLINELANSGLSILVISSELPEILGISDRIVVMCRGQVSGEYINEGLQQDELLKAASQVKVEGVSQ